MKRTLQIVLIIVLMLFGGIQIYIYMAKPTPDSELRKRAARVPPLVLKGLDDATYQLPKGAQLVLVYFNTSCEHCQLQLSEMKEKMTLFSTAYVFFMSAEPMEDIADFSSRLDLSQYSNARIVQVKHDQIAELFGVLSLPQIFVYSKEGDLLALFSGETKPDLIAGYIK